MTQGLNRRGCGGGNRSESGSRNCDGGSSFDSLTTSTMALPATVVFIIVCLFHMLLAIRLTLRAVCAWRELALKVGRFVRVTVINVSLALLRCWEASSVILAIECWALVRPGMNFAVAVEVTAAFKGLLAGVTDADPLCSSTRLEGYCRRRGVGCSVGRGKRLSWRSLKASGAQNITVR